MSNVRATWYDCRVSDSACIPSSVSALPATTVTLRHSALVRVTHWITTLCFFALLVSGAEIVISHPRFYWGETGNVLTTPLFKIPIPSSRALVPTGYGYVLPDQNGWSRALHFQSAWVVVLTGVLYAIFGLLTGHFRKDLLPGKADLSWRGLSTVIANHLRFERPSGADALSYNVVQRLTYLFVIFILFPLVIWTGLAMSPAFVSAFPATVTVLGGRQTARTLHFFVSLALLLFLLVHVAMIWLAGFGSRMRAMITGRVGTHMERT
jgi:thiosulfate reductase cytochrome b subunit